MDNATIIANVESTLPDDILNGNYVKYGMNMPLKAFLEEVLVNFISEGSTVEQVSKYIREKILPDVIPFKKEKPITIEYGSFENEDVKAAAEKYSNMEPPIVPIDTLDTEVNEANRIDYNLGKQAIDEFIENCVGFVSNVRTSEIAVVNTKTFLYSKIPFMNNDKKILVGEVYKSIEDVYYTLLNNTYRPATLVDKTELCMFFANQLDAEILASKIDKLNITTQEYIHDVLPKMMINATDISVSGITISVDQAIEKIAKFQKEQIEREKQKAENAKIDEVNRIGENPSILSEIKVTDKKEDGIEVTAEIPIVSSYLVSSDEVEALSNLSRDNIFDKADTYYSYLLNALKQSIKDTNNERDLTAKESGNNDFSFAVIAEKALQSSPTFEMQQLINSISELIGAKRNELIKVYSNYDEYCDAVMTEINALGRKLEMADSIDAFSEIKHHITRITIDLVTKNIKNPTIKQALDQLLTSYRKTFTYYNLTKSDFEKKKNKAIEPINDRLSDIKRSYISLLYLQDPFQNQSIITKTNTNIEAIKGEIQEAVDADYLTEEDAKSYYYELNKLTAMGFANNRMKA